MSAAMAVGLAKAKAKRARLRRNGAWGAFKEMETVSGSTTSTLLMAASKPATSV
jgi:hypothetical protein